MGRERHTSQRGAILLVLVITVVVMTILLGKAVQSWNTIATRDREAEFISRGTQIVDAIKRYQADNGKLPVTMQELYEPGPKGNSRYIRKKWKDPLTGKDWVLLWLAPDGATLFRSDGKPATTGSFQTAPGGVTNTNQQQALNLSQLGTPLGSAGYDADKNSSLLKKYHESLKHKVGEGFSSNAPGRAFAANPEVNLGDFDTGSSLLTTPGIGPIVGVATSCKGKAFLEWKGRQDYSGYEISILTFEKDRKGPLQGTAFRTDQGEIPGMPVSDPLSPQGCADRNTCPDPRQPLGGGNGGWGTSNDSGFSNNKKKGNKK